MYKFSIILICLLTLFIGKKLNINWINPGYIMILYWSVFISLALFFIDDNYEWQYFGLLWIIFALIFFLLGNLLGKNFVANKMNIVNIDKTNKHKILNKNSWLLLLGIIIIGIIRAFIEVGINGFSVQMFFNVDSLIEMNTTMASKRYNGGAESNVIMQILLIFIYAAPLCGGYSFAYSENKKQKLISLSSFIPIILNILLTNGKAGVIASICYWASGYFVAFLEKYKKAPKIKISDVFKISFLFLIMFAALITSMLLRVGDFSISALNIIIEKFGTYSLGSIAAFDAWFYTNPDFFQHTIGKYTFSVFFDLVGLSNLPQGIYKDLIFFPNGTSSNIYTVFRGLINDFGIVGSFIFLLLFGIISGFTFQAVIFNKQVSSFIKTFLAAIYFFILYSLLVSAWSYNSFFLAFIIFFIYLKVSNNKNFKSKSKSKLKNEL